MKKITLVVETTFDPTIKNKYSERIHSAFENQKTALNLIQDLNRAAVRAKINNVNYSYQNVTMYRETNENI